MAEYDNTNSGTLFKNEYKTKETQPTHKGSIEPKCPHCGEVSPFWLSAWVKTAAKSGKKFFSLSLTAKDDVKQQPVSTPVEEDFDDDIPF